MTKDEAMKLALEGAANYIDALGGDSRKYRQALAEQPAQQELEELTLQRDQLADILKRTANALKGQPTELCLHSWHDLPEVVQQLKAAQRTWVGLTRAERFEIEKAMSKYYDYQHECKTVCLPEFARAIEAKLKEKNT